jgi:hypothetical protein
MLLVALVAALATIAPQALDPARAHGAPSDEPCRLYGEFVDEAGAPVAGAVLRIFGGPASVLGASPGAPRGWQHVTSATTGGDGKFSLSFVPPRTFAFILTANAPGHGSVGWEWSALEPGQELDLGTKVLERKAVLAGHILDADGSLQVSGWNVTAALFERNGGVRGRSMTGNTWVDPATGEFRMEGLPPGTWIVNATKGSQHIEPVTVTTKLGEDTYIELSCAEPNPRRALVVNIGTPPFHTFQPDPGTVHAIARDGTRHLLTQAPGRPGEWGCEWRHSDVAPGTYQVEVRDPRFVDWTHSAVRTGESVSANLVGSASLRLEVVDHETGAPLEDYALVISYRNEPMRRSVFRVRERTASPPVDGVYTGIVPGDLTLLIESERWPACVEVDALAPGETRAIKVPVSHDFAATQQRVVSLPPVASRSGSVVLRGRVVDTRGQPLAGVAVQLTHDRYPGHDVPGTPAGDTTMMLGGKLVTIPVRYRDHATTTAADGWFYFSGLRPGTHALLVQRGPWNDVWKNVVLPSADPVVVALPDAAEVTVRLMPPEGESRDALHVRLAHAPGELRDLVRYSRTLNGVEDLWTPGADGMCPARYLPLGPQTLEVVRQTPNGPTRRYEVILRQDVTIVGPGPLELRVPPE